MDEILEFLKENKTYYLATLNDGAPDVRPFGTINEFEGRLYIQTGRSKEVYKQMKADPRISISACGSDGSWLRLSATAVEDDRIEASQALLDEYPELAPLYKAGDGNCTVLYLKDVEARIDSFTEESKAYRF